MDIACRAMQLVFNAISALMELPAASALLATKGLNVRFAKSASFNSLPHPSRANRALSQ